MGGRTTFCSGFLNQSEKRRIYRFGWDGESLVSDAGIFDASIEEVVRTLKEDGVVVLPPRLKKEAVRNLYELALSCPLNDDDIWCSCD